MTCKDCIHSGLCYKENDYDNFPDRCGNFISDKVLEARPHGEKIKKKYYGWVYCSECDSLLEPQDKFCWNCGADMRGKKKETTFDDYLKEQLKDPEFRKEWEKLCNEDMQKGDTE